MAKIITIANQKGGVGKTTLAVNLGISLSRMGWRVCLIDCDPQANLTMVLGYNQPDELSLTISHVMQEVIDTNFDLENSKLIQDRGYILKNKNVDFIPSNISLIGLENILVNVMSRENILKRFIDYIKDDYDFILIDTMPSLNLITINALNSAGSVLIPMQPQYLSAKGLELLLSTIGNIKKVLNPSLKIEGVLITMYDSRLTFHKEIVDILKNGFSNRLKIFTTKIPVSVRVTETQSKAESIFDYDPNGKVSESYESFAKELLNNA